MIRFPSILEWECFKLFCSDLTLTFSHRLDSDSTQLSRSSVKFDLQFVSRAYSPVCTAEPRAAQSHYSSVCRRAGTEADRCPGRLERDLSLLQIEQHCIPTYLLITCKLTLTLAHVRACKRNKHVRIWKCRQPIPLLSSPNVIPLISKRPV